MGTRIGWLALVALGGFLFFCTVSRADDPFDQAVHLTGEIKEGEHDLEKADGELEAAKDELNQPQFYWGAPKELEDKVSQLKQNKAQLTQSVADKQTKLKQIKDDMEKEQREKEAFAFKLGQTVENVQQTANAFVTLAEKVLDAPVTPPAPTAAGIYQDAEGKRFFVAPDGKRYDFSYSLPSAEGGMSTHFVDPEDSNKGYIVDSAGIHQAQKMLEPGAWNMGVAVRAPTGQFTSAIGQIGPDGRATIFPPSGAGFGSDFSPPVPAPAPQTVGQTVQAALHPVKTSASTVVDTVRTAAPVVANVGKIPWVLAKWLY